MRRITTLIFYLILSLLVVACGGDTGFVGTNQPAAADPTDPTETVVSAITLLSSNPELKSGDLSGVTISAIVRDSGNLVLENKTVIFSANSGGLQVVSATTNAEGIATAQLTTGGDEASRIITVSAFSGEVTSTIDVSVTGTVITVAGQSSMVLTGANTLTLTLKDSLGAGIFNEDLTVTSSLAATLTETAVTANTGANTLTVTTDSSGQAQINVEPGVSGVNTVSVAGLGTFKTFPITVSSDVFALTMPGNASGEVDLGVQQQLQIQYEDNAGPIADNTPVTFVTTRGTLVGANPALTTGGLATINISSLNAGPATIQAYVASGPSTTIYAEFVATTAATIDVQASISTVSLGGGQATITATVRDAANNLVKNKRVNFSVQDITGGTLTVATDITDSNGQASTVYTSSATSGGTDGVTVTALVDDGSNVTNSVNLTVGNRALFITLGSGNEIFEPDETNYQKPFTVRVADASGVGVANETVTLKLIPERYFKGVYAWDPVAKWYITYSIDTTADCLNEDRNEDGIFDAAIDVDENGDGLLWPGTVATVSESPVVTNEAGEASFTVNYSQEFAQFVYVRLEATAQVGGTEAKNTSRFRLPVLAADVATETVAPPARDGLKSPFGTAASCGNAN